MYVIRQWHSALGMANGTEHFSGGRVSATEPNELINDFLIMSCDNQLHNMHESVSVMLMATCLPSVATTVPLHTFGTVQGRT